MQQRLNALTINFLNLDTTNGEADLTDYKQVHSFLPILLWCYGTTTPEPYRIEVQGEDHKDYAIYEGQGTTTQIKRYDNWVKTTQETPWITYTENDEAEYWHPTGYHHRTLELTPQEISNSLRNMPGNTWINRDQLNLNDHHLNKKIDALKLNANLGLNRKSYYQYNCPLERYLTIHHLYTTDPHQTYQDYQTKQHQLGLHALPPTLTEFIRTNAEDTHNFTNLIQRHYKTDHSEPRHTTEHHWHHVYEAEGLY